jgi:hypothetical protein
VAGDPIFQFCLRKNAPKEKIVFCPRCEAEYLEGISQCADCKISLVERLPEDEGPGEEPAAVDSDLFPIMTFLNNEEALIAKGFLESNGVDAIISSEESFRAHRGLSSPRGIQLLIRKEDQPEAEKIFRLAGIHPQDRPYLYERELPEMDIERNWKQVAARILLEVLLLVMFIFFIKHLLE